jgi:hypothetical protein
MNKHPKKLALKEKLCGNYENLLNISRDGLLKYGKISKPYLMRKLKCSQSMACRIIKELSPIS